MARALWWTSRRSPEAVRDTVEDLGRLSPEAQAMVRSAEFQLALDKKRAGQMDPSALESAAEKWANADSSPAAALEWLAAAIGAHDADREVRARAHLAERLQGPARAAIEASAQLVAALAGVERAPGDVMMNGEHPSALFANAEIAAPTTDPRRRAAALLGIGSVLGEESDTLCAVLAGYNLLAAGNARAAAQAFQRATAGDAKDISAWEGLRAAALALGDRRTVARAAAVLGDTVGDSTRGAELWEHAAAIYLDELKENAQGEQALLRAVERDINRFSSFDRLFRLVRARKDGPRLLELIGARLTVADDPDEIAKLFWERARTLRQMGDSVGALQALENVIMLEPDHVGALALTGEIFISERRFEEAAQKLARLAELDDAPRQQRLMSGIAAVDLYENKVDDLDAALAVLLNLYRSGLSTSPARERLARVAAKAERWDDATSILEELMHERETAEGRVEAARLAMTIHCDKLGNPKRAAAAVERLLAESPGDPEALDLVLASVFDPALSHRLLERGRAASIARLVKAPFDPESAARLAEIAAAIDDAPLRQVALGVLIAMGGGNREVAAELALLDQRVARTPLIAIDDAAVGRIRDDGDTGPIPELFIALAPTLSEALGPGLGTFGVTKKDRVKPQVGLPLRNEVAAWAGALGIGEFEFFLGGADLDGVFAVATEPLAIIMGKGVSSPLSPMHRQHLARELLALKLGTTILRHRDPPDIAALVAAACRIAGVPLDTPQYAMLGDFERQLARTVPRRIKKLLPEICQRIKDTRQDPLEWVRAATSTLDRMAAIAVGDVSWVLAVSGAAQRGQPPVTNEARARAARLLAFVLSDDFFSVRDQLKMGLR